MATFTRSQTRVLTRRSLALGCVLFSATLALYVAALGGAALAQRLWLQSLFGVATALAIVLLFIVGHDACHGSFTPSRRANRWIGTLAFLPSLHPFSLWDLGHNRIHHRFTNLAPRDYVWTPLSRDEYGRLSSFGRRKYRFYRSLWGPLLYYLVEIWWRKMFLPRPQEVDEPRRAYRLDSAAVLVYAVGLCGALLLLPQVSSAPRPWWGPIWFAGLGPFLLWNALMSFVIYLHHTHPGVAWYRDESAWRASRAQAECTVHVTFPGPVNRLLLNIMEHTAHHVSPGIPLYRLPQAQSLLETANAPVVPEATWSPRYHLDVVRRCKLYDFDRRRWETFETADGRTDEEARIA